MIGGHLGSRTSALLDGQLPHDEAERAWAHVHSCHTCRDRVEREGWVKTRVAGLAFDPCASSAPDRLKGSLLGALSYLPDGAGSMDEALRDQGRRNVAVVATGGAVGAAMVGLLALWAAPAQAPTMDRQAPVTSISRSLDPPAAPATTAPLRRAHHH